MKTKFVFFLVFSLFTGLSAFAQFNDYKYVIVPKKFDGYKEQNKYQTSTTIKYLLTKRGFNAVYDDALPDDLFNDRCLGLIVNLQDDSSFFTTKTTIIFKDCRSVEVFRTIEGKSKIKEFKPAYTQAINRAFVSLEGIDGTYQPKETKKEPSSNETLTLNFKNDVKTLKEDAKEVVIEQEATEENQTYKAIQPKPAIEEAKDKMDAKKGESKEVVIEQEATPDNQTYKAISPKPALFKKAGSTDILYAQPIENGYQLVDSTPKIRYKLVETSAKGFFLVSEGDKQGIVFQKDGVWRLEFVQNGVKKVEEMNIKF